MIRELSSRVNYTTPTSTKYDLREYRKIKHWLSIQPLLLGQPPLLVQVLPLLG
jgi:hypothetical protein